MADKVLTHPKFQQAQAMPVVDNDFTRSLRELLAQAEKGEIVAYALIGVGPGARTYGFVGDVACLSDDVLELIGCLNLLRDDMSDSLRDHYANCGEDPEA